jgi:hypothetical protein
MNLKFIEPKDLRLQWSWVREGLEKVRNKGHDDWIVEDIYCDCYEGRSLLWIASEGNINTGLMVLQQAGSTMHVWAVYIASGDIIEGFQHIKEISNISNCNRITFSSNRAGWTRKAKAMGFTQKVWELTI